MKKNDRSPSDCKKRTGSRQGPATRIYVRYCMECGWGFTRGQWARARYCPSCGNQVRKTPAAARDAVTSANNGAQRQDWRTPRSVEAEAVSVPRYGEVQRLPANWEGPSRSAMLLTHGKEAAARAVEYAKRKPITASVALAAGSGVAIVAGQMTVACGHFLMIAGAIVTGLGFISTAGGVYLGEPAIHHLGRKHMGTGAKIMLVGIGLTAAGTVAMCGGVAGLVGSAGLATHGAIQHRRRYQLSMGQNAEQRSTRESNDRRNII